MDAFYEVQLSTNFKGKEFRCQGEMEGSPCCCHGRTGIHLDLVDALQVIRDTIWGGPMLVRSGFRCDAYNEHIGGHPRSYHRVGMAADIQGRPGDNWMEDTGGEISEILEAMYGSVGGAILYPNNNFVHIDLGSYKDRSRIRVKTGRGKDAPILDFGDWKKTL